MKVLCGSVGWMIKLADYLSELWPLVAQLEAFVASGEVAEGPRLFEWRIRARLIEDKLQQAARPPRELGEGEEAPEVLPTPPKFTPETLDLAQRSLGHANSLREAIHNRKVKVALEAARAIVRLISAG